MVVSASAQAATMTVLKHREKRQVRSLHAHRGTITFFRNHVWLAKTKPGRKALRVARVWIPILRRELRETRSSLHPDPAPMSVPTAICAAFGSYCSQALAVARCESTLRPWAANGQYRGLFQMGSHERATYGDGPDAWSQALAAHRYFVSSGSDWSPWECKP